MHALDVPGHRHQIPLALGLVQPAHAHLAPAHHLLDDASLPGKATEFVRRRAILAILSFQVDTIRHPTLVRFVMLHKLFELAWLARKTWDRYGGCDGALVELFGNPR